MRYITRLICLSLGCAAAALSNPIAAEELGQNFRGQRYDLKKFRPTGPNTGKTIQSDGQGLRLTLPATRPNQLPVGLIAKSGIRGDFEIILAFEIIKVDRPTTGIGAGVSIWISLPTPARDTATLSWLFNTHGEKMFVANRAFSPAGGEREYHGVAPLPTRSLSGRLRLSRRGTTLTYAIAEGTSTEFRELYLTELSDADVETVRFAADTGSSRTGIDVRINEIMIQGENLATARIVSHPKSRWPLWLASAIAAALMVGAAVWYRSLRTA